MYNVNFRKWYFFKGIKRPDMKFYQGTTKIKKNQGFKLLIIYIYLSFLKDWTA